MPNFGITTAMTTGVTRAVSAIVVPATGAVAPTTGQLWPRLG